MSPPVVGVIIIISIHSRLMRIEATMSFNLFFFCVFFVSLKMVSDAL